MIFSLIYFSLSSISDDLIHADDDTVAQAFMERCIDQKGDEVLCREKTISMFGTSGLTDIDINLNGKKVTKNEDNQLMTVLIHRGRKDKRSVTCHKSECVAPNTIYYGGQCHCRLFFDHGNPLETGCWRCKPKCKNSAICTQHDGCVCKNYTVGDGYKKCEIHVPNIIRAYAKSDMKTIMVDIKPVTWQFPHVAYCKFSNIIIEGKLISNSTIKCVRKSSIKKDTKVDVSWDSLTFSHQKMEVSERDHTESDIGPVIIGVVMLFLLIIVYFGFLYKKGSSKGVSLEKYAERIAAGGKL